MNGIIERDAVQGTSVTLTLDTPHAHEDEIKSFIVTPRMDKTLWEKAKGLFATDVDPMLQVLRKEGHGPRYLLSITSNAYVDRDNERILSDALKEYEASCYPGDGLFHCDNPYVWWHDDDVVMGEIVAVNYSEPFLVEIIQEIEGDPVSKVLFDFAEKNGHEAGASHRYGYLEKDRLPNGEFKRIFKQESTYLPKRALAANGMTYAGVLTEMASKQSNEWLDKIFNEATGIENVSTMLHDKSSERAKKLAELKGLIFKAAKPPIPPLPKEPPMEGTVVEDEVVEEDAKDTPSGMTMDRMLIILEGINDLLFQLQEADEGSLDRDMALVKEFQEFKEFRVNEKALQEKATQTLEERVKALESQLTEAQKRLSLAPRSASREVGTTDPELAKIQVAESIDGAEKAKKESNKRFDPFWGEISDLPT